MSECNYRFEIDCALEKKPFTVGTGPVNTQFTHIGRIVKCEHMGTLLCGFDLKHVANLRVPQ